MNELSTPKEMIQKMVLLVENERKTQKLQQKELSKKASIPFPTYKEFLYNNKISFENLLKILVALRLFENINSFLQEKKTFSLEDVKNEKQLPKRIVK